MLRPVNELAALEADIRAQLRETGNSAALALAEFCDDLARMQVILAMEGWQWQTK